MKRKKQPGVPKPRQDNRPTLAMRWHGTPLRWRIFFYLLAFSLTMVCLLWLFQVVYLDDFYERVKTENIKQSALAIREGVTQGDVQAVVMDLAQRRQICVSLYNVQDNGWKVSFLRTASADVLSDCIIHHIGSENIASYYFSARDNGGVFSERISRAQFSLPGGQDGDARFWEARDITLPDSLVYASVFQDADGQTHLLLLNASISPVHATVSTLRQQLVWISAILVLLALILSNLIASRLSRPICRLTRSAHALAGGNFAQHFDGGGYREINELADSLNYAAAELGRSEKLQRDIVANISHDLRTPLTMIGGYAEYMRDFPEEDRVESLAVIIQETQRLTRLVNDVLDYSRLSSGTQQISCSEFDLSESLRDFVNRYNALLEPEGYRIGLSIDQEVIVNADEARILQALGNILNNALTHAGADKLIQVRQETGEGLVKVWVIDHGPGIAAEDLPHIWDRYYHADAPERAGHSSGLGLSIVKGIMELHHAQYGVESGLGQGCRFWLRLPYVRAEDLNRLLSAEDEDA